MKFFGKFYYVFLAVMFLALFFILENASINGLIFPFSFAMLFALIWANQKIWLVAPAYLVAAIIVNHSLAGIISAIVCAAMIVVPFILHTIFKKNIQVWQLALYALFSQAGYIGFAAATGTNAVIFAVVSAVVGVVFMLGFVKLFEALFMRGFAYRLSAIEYVAGGIILIGLSAGLVNLDLYGFSFLKLFVSFVLLAITYCSKNYYSVFIASILGLGTLLSANNPVFFAPFVIWALAISPFKTYRKYFTALAIILAELVIGFYFNLYYSFDWLGILPVAISAIIFVLIPDKVYAIVKSIFDLRGDRAAIKNVVNQNRELLHRRLLSLSDVFGEMDRVFRGLVRRNLSEDEVKKLLRNEIIARNCETCPDRARCHRTREQDTLRVMDELTAIAFEKGKVTLLDIPSYLSANCGRVNGIITSAATLARQYKSYSGMLSNIDTSKLLIADQLKGISSVMKNLSQEVDHEIAFDGKREDKIIEELLFNDIVCTDAIVYERDAHTFEINLIVRNLDADKLKIPAIVGKICKCNMAVVDKYAATRPGYTALSLKTAPKLDCVFALANTPKSGSEVSGDTHSIMRLDGNRFMFAICDGMGSGSEAEQVSQTAISLIENFYKAGFDSELVLSSVNKLLSLQKEDKFSALDVCVLDLKSGLGDFIKMGAPCGFVVSEEDCKLVESGALPLGIVDKFNPVTKKLVVSDGDIVVMFSDGVADAFATDKSIEDFVKSAYSPNPQIIADKLLEQALANCNGRAMDDMTVLAIKIFNNQ